MKKKPAFGINATTGHMHVGSARIKIPKSRIARISIGVALVFGGLLGFLPILGFWMVPLGLLLLSNDLAFVRRRRRKLALWWGRRRALSKG